MVTTDRSLLSALITLQSYKESVLHVYTLWKYFDLYFTVYYVATKTRNI